jgi:hypothetical protein
MVQLHVQSQVQSSTIVDSADRAPSNTTPCDQSYLISPSITSTLFGCMHWVQAHKVIMSQCMQFRRWLSEHTSKSSSTSSYFSSSFPTTTVLTIFPSLWLSMPAMWSLLGHYLLETRPPVYTKPPKSSLMRPRRQTSKHRPNPPRPPKKYLRPQHVQTLSQLPRTTLTSKTIPTSPTSPSQGFSGSFFTTSASSLGAAPLLKLPSSRTASSSRTNGSPLNASSASFPSIRSSLAPGQPSFACSSDVCRPED